MNKAIRLLLVILGILVLIALGTIIVNWEKHPWSPGYKPSPVYLPPSVEIVPTATFFSPSVVTPTTDINLVWIDPDIPDTIISQLKDNETIKYSEEQSQAATALLSGIENPLIEWIYVLAAPFPTIEDGISDDQIMSAWKEGNRLISSNQPILLSQESLDVLTAWWGEPSPDAVKVLPEEELSSYAWSHRPSLAIFPFEELSKEWKVIQVDGISPLDDDFETEDYYLSVPISAVGSNPNLLQDLVTNRDPDKFTSVVLTGVTALVRATAWEMENHGINHPAMDIREWLIAADILHISNEVPFVRGCPYPNPSQEGLRFCSDSRYIELMEYIGTDVVELTGDHFGDFGPEAMLYTLELYQERNWPYYGGGADKEDAQEPVLFEHNGNKIAFLGCNAKGGGYATAGPGYPGAVACDFTKMSQQIRDLRDEGYLPIATFQHFEYYTYIAQPNQIRDARSLTSAGAVIVSGSQAHQPQAFEIEEDAFIHHGLGNLFFDQIYEIPPNTATAFIDRHIFYNGRHINTELFTIKFLDFARARPMTAVERKELLNLVFDASGW